MSEGSKRSAPELEGPNKAPRTDLLSTPAGMPPPNIPTDPIDKEIYMLHLRERILQQEAAKLGQETAKMEAEVRLLKARTDAARATEAAEEEDFFSEDLPGEITAAIDTIRNRFGTVPDKYLKQIYHDKFDPKNIIRLSPPLGTTTQDGDDDTKLDITATTIRIRKTSAALKEYGSTPLHWARAYGVYGAILCNFFALQNPSLPGAIFHFFWQIQTLAESYSWQEACLPLAVSALERVRTQGRLDPNSWDIPQSLLTNYCRWDRLREAPRPRPGPTSEPPTRRSSLREDTNNNKVICQKYRELGFCPWPGVCKRQHSRDDNAQANKHTA